MARPNDILTGRYFKFQGVIERTDLRLKIEDEELFTILIDYPHNRMSCSVFSTFGLRPFHLHHVLLLFITSDPLGREVTMHGDIFVTHKLINCA